MTKIILPRGYLSSSQMDCWMSSKERYRKQYFERTSKLDTKYLRFGSEIAKMIEEGKHKEILPDLVVYSHREFEIRCDIKGVPIFSKLDSYDPVKNVFRDDKTGKNPWDQAKVQKSNQMLFYATALKCLTGKMPEYCHLDWIETKEGGVPVDDFWREKEGCLNVTGKIVSFMREFDEREIERMEDLIVKIAEEISEAYQEFIKEI